MNNGSYMNNRSSDQLRGHRVLIRIPGSLNRLGTSWLIYYFICGKPTSHEHDHQYRTEVITLHTDEYC